MLKEKPVEFLGCEKFWLGANVLFLKDRAGKEKRQHEVINFNFCTAFLKWFIFRNYSLSLW